LIASPSPQLPAAGSATSFFRVPLNVSPFPLSSSTSSLQPQLWTSLWLLFFLSRSLHQCLSEPVVFFLCCCFFLFFFFFFCSLSEARGGCFSVPTKFLLEPRPSCWTVCGFLTLLPVPPVDFSTTPPVRHPSLERPCFDNRGRWSYPPLRPEIRPFGSRAVFYLQ